VTDSRRGRGGSKGEHGERATSRAAGATVRYALIADDLTGALDAGAGFVRAGLRSILPYSGLPADAPEADVLLIDTHTRDGTEDAARRTARQAAERLHAAGIARVYKKIDSVLRGFPGAELAAVLDVYGGRALVAPAFPAQGRTTAGGVQLVHGRPAGPYQGDVRAALGPAADRCDVFDAQTDEDLERIARLGAARPEYRVWCGTAGLARHVASALALVPRPGSRPPALPPSLAVIAIAGSVHPATLAQIRAALDAGWAHVPLAACEPDTGTSAETSEGSLRQRLGQALAHSRRVLLSFAPLAGGREQVGGATGSGFDVAAAAGALGRAARAIPLDSRPALILTGGETAWWVCRALGTRTIEVLAEALSGIPAGVLTLAEGQVAVATKSGGFGAPDALLTVAEFLLRGG
jgi:uncharacterized protein YgbK (DUF1537 family)